MFEKFIDNLFDYYMGFRTYSLRNLNNQSMDNIIKSLKTENYSIEQIANLLREESGERKHFVTLQFSNNNELENKINEALKLLEMERIYQFKKAVDDGTYEDFLDNLDIYDRMSLYCFIGTYGNNVFSENNIYRQIISGTMEKDINGIVTSLLSPEDKLFYMLRDSLGLTNQKNHLPLKKLENYQRINNY